MAIISVTGTNYIGKTTFVNDFIKKWPEYKLIGDPTLLTLDNKLIKKDVKRDFEKHEIFELNIAIEQLKGFNKKDKVIIDNCILQNLLRVLHYKDKNPKNINDDAIWKFVMKVKNNISMYDVIFYIPLSKKYSVDVKDKTIDIITRQEIAHMFEEIISTYKCHAGSYFPLDRCPAILEIFGSPKERLALTELYMEDINNIK